MAWTTPRTWVANENVSAATMNTHIRDNLLWLFDGEAWIGPSFINSWVNYDTTFYGPARYRRVGGWVFMEGLIKNGTIAAAAFNLPVGYRPNNHQIFLSVSIDAAARVDVDNTGNVTVVAGSNSWASITRRFPIG